MLDPLGWYLVSHFLAWHRQKLTAIMVLGYALTVLILACFVSGARGHVAGRDSGPGFRRDGIWCIS